jgi:hypothetical protein
MNRQRASASIYVLMVIAVLLFASLGASTIALNSVGRAKNDERAAIAFNAAHATLEFAVTDSLARLRASGGVFTRHSEDISASAVASLAPGAAISYTVIPSTGDPASGWITSTVTFEGLTKSVRGWVSARDVGVWNNAIFAGTGASGRSINGNVDIRGSVHILGEGEPYVDANGNGRWDAAESFTDTNRNGVWDPGEPFEDRNGDGVWTSAEPFNDVNRNGTYDPPLVQTDLSSNLSGTALIGNHYGGMSSTLRSHLPAPPTVGGLETLSTEVRVKHGQISINGNAMIGQNGTIDGSRKGSIEGLYVNDGITGNSGANNVFSDNGTSNSYDLDSLGITMPLLSGIGAQEYVDSDGTRWTNQQEFLNARSLTVPITQISDSTNFSYGPDAFGNSIRLEQENPGQAARLTIEGIVRINGDLSIFTTSGTNSNGTPKRQRIEFMGSGTLYSTGSVNIDTTLLPGEGQLFPTGSRIGIIARNDINLGTGSGSSQLKMMGAFYAQGTIRSGKQNEIGGTFVANYFDMGTNVPNIFQVPSLRNNLPPGMPGSGSIVFLRMRGWRERQ